MDTLEKLSASEHPQISVEELLECEKVVKNDPRVQKLAKAVGQLFSRYNWWMLTEEFRGRASRNIL